MKPMSKPPGTKRLKLKCDELLSSFAFNFNLRRYNTGAPVPSTVMPAPEPRAPLSGPAPVGWRSLTLSNPR